MKIFKNFIFYSIFSGIICSLFYSNVEARTLLEQYLPSIRDLGDYKIPLFIGLIISIYGIYRSKTKKVVAFANFTDIAMTAAIPIIPIVFLLILALLGFSKSVGDWLIDICAIIVILCVLKATWSYNQSINSGIIGFLLSSFTKLYLCGIYILVLVLIAFWRFIMQRSEFKVATTTGIAGLLTYFGLWNKNWVTFKQYINGDWGLPNAYDISNYVNDDLGRLAKIDETGVYVNKDGVEEKIFDYEDNNNDLNNTENGEIPRYFKIDIQPEYIEIFYDKTDDGYKSVKFDHE